MCTGLKKEEEATILILQVEEKRKAEAELVRVGATEEGDCCDPVCGPSTCSC